MKIQRISVWQLDLPLSQPYYLSGGRLKFEQLDSTFICIQTDNGVQGWGEACPWGHTYLAASGNGIRAAVTYLAPAVLGQDPCALQHLNRVMDQALPGHLAAKSAIDIACWDILGKVTAMPLWRLLGANAPHAVAVNSSISTGTPKEMLASIEVARRKNYKTHSAKIGGNDIALDIARINAIESARLPDEKITYDINRAWVPATAIEILNSVTTRGWIEQPCQTLEQCQRVRTKASQPIMLDECLSTYNDHLDAWRHVAADGIKLKPNRVGGLTKAVQIRDFAIAVNWQMHIEDVGGSALADTVAIHLAAATPPDNRLASWLCHEHLSIDPVPAQGARNIDGYATPPDSAGIGVTPDPSILSTLAQPVTVYEN